ncbi:MAG: DUF669 domain-containing protein [Verrucomicrobiota bacterium]
MPSYKSSEPTSRPDFVPAGDYTVEILNAEESVSKQGNDMIELKLKIEPTGAICFDNLVFTPNAFWKIDAFRASTGESVVPDEEVNIECDDLLGRTGRARLIVEEYNGRKRNKVAAWLAREISKGGRDDNQPF